MSDYLDKSLDILFITKLTSDGSPSIPFKDSIKSFLVNSSSSLSLDFCYFPLFIAREIACSVCYKAGA